MPCQTPCSGEKVKVISYLQRGCVRQNVIKAILARVPTPRFQNDQGCPESGPSNFLRGLNFTEF